MIERKDYKKRLYTLFTTFFGILVQTGLVYIVWINYYNPILPKGFFYLGHYFVMTLYTLMMCFFTQICGGFKLGYLKSSEIKFAQTLANICTNIAFYLILSLLAYRFPNPFYLLIIMVGQVLFLIIWTSFMGRGYRKLFPPHQVLLIYNGNSVKEFHRKLQVREDKFFVKEMISEAEGIEKIQERLEEYDTVMLWDLSDPLRNQLFKYCYGKGTRIYIMPRISDIILKGAQTMHFFDTPLLLTRSTPLFLEQRFIKRLVDLFVAVIITIITSPLMLIAAIAVKCYDGGSILYKQQRCTKDERIFWMYKFRSMIEDAEQDGVARLAKKSDSRITPVGKVIRATRIDELPQLFNVIKGDMSLVGPRPERPEIIERYEKERPDFSFRMKVKAGLTGYAQIYGKYNTTPYDKLKLDLYYIENYSLLLDLKLLIQTVRIVFTLESTEGVEENSIIEEKSTAGKEQE